MNYSEDEYQDHLKWYSDSKYELTPTPFQPFFTALANLITGGGIIMLRSFPITKKPLTTPAKCKRDDLAPLTKDLDNVEDSSPEHRILKRKKKISIVPKKLYATVKVSPSPKAKKAILSKVVEDEPTNENAPSDNEESNNSSPDGGLDKDKQIGDMLAFLKAQIFDVDLFQL